MKSLDNKEVLNQIYKAAKEYDKNLLNKNVMFILQNKNAKSLEDEVIKIETKFQKSNFLHLTGVEYIPKENIFTSKSKPVSKSVNFYNNLIKGKISFNDIKIKNNYITTIKLDSLYYLGQIDKSAKFLGDYDNTCHDKLVTQKKVGNISYCFGFVLDEDTGFYVPNTTLKEDIKELTNDTYNILAILKKDVKDECYKDLTYIKDGFNMNLLLRNKYISEIIDFENLNYTNKDNIKNISIVDNFKEELDEIVDRSIRTLRNEDEEEM